jgi:hypothetical protein
MNLKSLFAIVLLYCTPILLFAQGRNANIAFSANIGLCVVEKPYETSYNGYGYSIQYSQNFKKQPKLYWGVRLTSFNSYGYDSLKVYYDIDRWRNVSIVEFSPLLYLRLFDKQRWKNIYCTVGLNPSIRFRDHVGLDLALFQGVLVNGVVTIGKDVVAYSEFHEQVIDFGIAADLENRFGINDKLELGLSVGLGFYTNRIVRMAHGKLALYYYLGKNKG